MCRPVRDTGQRIRKFRRVFDDKRRKGLKLVGRMDVDGRRKFSQYGVCRLRCQVREIAITAYVQLNQVLRPSGPRTAKDVAEQLCCLAIGEMAVVPQDASDERGRSAAGVFQPDVVIEFKR